MKIGNCCETNKFTDIAPIAALCKSFNHYFSIPMESCVTPFSLKTAMSRAWYSLCDLILREYFSSLYPNNHQNIWFDGQYKSAFNDATLCFG